MSVSKLFDISIDTSVSTVYTVNIQSIVRMEVPPSGENDTHMNIFIDNKSGEPIYTQIYTQLKNQILGGNLVEDQALPSIRSLAKDLRISVITTKRASDELEREGFINAVADTGYY